MEPTALPGIGSKVEGIHAVKAALDAGRVSKLLIETSRKKRLGELLSQAGTKVQIQYVADVRPEAETTAPQGVVAICRPIATVSLEDLASGDRPAILVLDHLEDPHNVGAIARSALAAGMSGLVVSSVRSAPLGSTAFKASVGALEKLPVAVVSSVANALSRLRQLGVWTVGLDAQGTESLFGLGLASEPIAVVIGAEGAGLAQLVAERCDVIVSIPMAEASESLNASVAAALAAFEIRRARSD